MDDQSGDGASEPKAKQPKLGRLKDGRHQSNRFTPLDIKNLKTPGRHADGRGLYVLVEPTGAKRWVFRLMHKGRSFQLGLGNCQDVSLADARAKVDELRKVAKAGDDIMASHRKRSEGVPTFEEAARRLHTELLETWKNGKHTDQWITTLETYAFPKIGIRQVHDIKHDEVRAVLRPIWNEIPETARRVRQRMHAVFDWAMSNNFREADNPVPIAANNLPKRGKVEHHAALDYKKVPAFIKALHASKASLSGMRALEFLILTAARSGEARGAVWGEVDLEAKLWTIPAERMKADEEHCVPLPDRAIDILREMHDKAVRKGPEHLIFPGMIGQVLSDNTLSKLARELGFGHITAHGFRSSFRDWVSEETSFPGEIAEAALAHTVKSKVEAAYRRGKLLDKRRDLMTMWADHVTGKVTGSNVVSMAGHKATA